MKLNAGFVVIGLALVGCLPAQKLAKTVSDQRTVETDAGNIHIMPMRSPEDEGFELTLPAGRLHYFGGPIISNVELVPVFWGPNVAPTTQQNIPQFLSDYAQSAVFDWASEYNTNQSIGRGSAASAVTITPPTSKSLTNSAIQRTIEQEISAGTLPIPTPNMLYMIYLPPDHQFSNGNFKSCAPKNGLCAYHGTFKRPTGNVYYAVIADMSPGSGCYFRCGPGTMFDNLTTASSHEIMESVTDPAIGLTNIAAAPLAWYDKIHGEIGDICKDRTGPLSANGKTYEVQMLYSNLAQDCIITAADKIKAPLTADLSVNGKSKITVAVGAVLNFKWSSKSAVIAKSTVTADSADNCSGSTNPTFWLASTISGSSRIVTARCQAGHTYTFTYVVANATGAEATSSVVVSVTATRIQ